MPLLQVCEWVCAWVSVCVSVSAVIDTSDSIEYDSQRLSFNTHATARHVPLTHAQSSSLSQCDGNANNNTNNERRSVRTLTAAAATYTPEFSCDENWRWLRWRRLPAPSTAMAFAGCTLILFWMLADHYVTA